MKQLSPGNIIAFRLRDDWFGIAKVVVCENLALHDAYHFVIYDAVLADLPEEIDLYGLPLDQAYGITGVEELPIVVNHLAVRPETGEGEDVVLVGHMEPVEEEFDGYRVWLSLMRENARRQGLLRYETNEQEESDQGEEYEDGEYENEESGDENTDSSDVRDEPQEITAAVEPERKEEANLAEISSQEQIEGAAQGKPDEALVMEIDGREIPIYPWHQYLDASIGAALFQWHEVFEKPALKSTRLGDFICSFYDERSEAIVAELVDRLQEGDYSAGHELVQYDDRAVEALKRLLADGTTPENAADALQIMSDIGTGKATEEIAAFFAKHYRSRDEEMSLTASRAYLYAVMVMGGASPALRAHFDKIEEISHPDLEDDVREALRAIGEYEGAKSAEPAPVVPEKAGTPWEG